MKIIFMTWLLYRKKVSRKKVSWFRKFLAKSRKFIPGKNPKGIHSQKFILVKKTFLWKQNISYPFFNGIYIFSKGNIDILYSSGVFQEKSTNSPPIAKVYSREISQKGPIAKVCSIHFAIFWTRESFLQRFLPLKYDT